MRLYWLALCAALSWTVAPASGPPVSDPVADLFEPRPSLPPGVREQPLGPLRLPDAALSGTNSGTGVIRLGPPARAAAPRRPPFPLNTGDRVLLLGDAVLEAEARHGYLETRLQVQHPTNAFVVRNLSGSPHNRLRESDPSGAAQDGGWLTNLLTEIRAVRPNVIFLSYGTAPGLTGIGSLAAFSNVYSRVIEGLVALDTNDPPRLVVCSPLSYEPVAGETLTEVTNRNQVLLEFADTAWQISTNHQSEFVDFFLFSRNEILPAQRQREPVGDGKAAPPWTTDRVTPTPYGLWRLAYALERGLRWPSTNWRFGLMADGTWREGGFGAKIASHRRTDDFVQVNFTEERLPMPNPAEDADVTAESRPQCYIQIRSLKDGMYDLRVDGVSVLQGTHQDWNRYEIITRGPSWTQAGTLRQAIVAKNALWLEAWQPQRELSAATADAADSTLAQREADIARLKRPVARVYQIVRTGEVPDESSSGKALER